MNQLTSSPHWLWLTAPFVDPHQIAAYLYGSRSRLHTHRLKLKMSGKVSFQSWEVERLESLRSELLRALN